MSLLGGTYGSRELEINSNDAKRGDGCLQADLSGRIRTCGDSGFAFLQDRNDL
jgi:hypothetical protein